MCDFGRHNYHWMNRSDRLEVPVVRGKAMDWPEALQALLEALKEGRGAVKAVSWPHASNEEMGLLRALVEALGGGEIVYRSPRAPDEVVLPGFPALARRKELAPNGKGAGIQGFVRVGDDEARGGLEGVAGHEGVVLVVGEPLADMEGGFGSRASLFVYMGSYPSPAAANAHFVLPIATFSEQEGSWTNVQGRVQRYWPALQAPGAARPGWMILGALLAELTQGDAPGRADQAFAQVAQRTPAYAGITYRNVGTRGAPAEQPAAVSGD
jgi:predicted molibdopterin-dependent oxidoreductase YjgC